jgi:hypothetical protein
VKKGKASSPSERANSDDDEVVVKPVPDLAVSISGAGELELSSVETGGQLRCEGAPVAMWIALVQHDGRVGEAAETLAGIWNSDLADIRLEMMVWAHKLFCLGLVREE